MMIGRIVQDLIDTLVAFFGKVFLAGLHMRMCNHIVRLSFLNRMLGTCKSLLGIIDNRPLFIFNFDFGKSPVAGYGVLGNNGRDIVSVNAYARIQKLTIGKIAFLGTRIRIPRVTGHRIGMFGYVKARIDADDTRHLTSLRRIDRFDNAVSYGCMQNLRFKARFGAEVIGIVRTTGDLVIRINSYERSANFF